MAQIPMGIVYELEIWQGEFLLYQRCQLFLYRFCPSTNKDDELIDVPCHPATRDLCVIAFEFGLFMGGLRTEILFCPYLTMQMGIVDEWQTFVCRFLYHLWRQLGFTDTKE